MTSRRPRRDDDNTTAGFAIGGLGPILLSCALVAVRDDIEHTTAVLLLVLVVVLAAIAGGRAAGALAAVVSAVSFDFFLTRPYQSLRIESASDIQTTIMLLVIGLVVGQVVVVARRSRAAAQQAAEEVDRLRRVAELAASGAGPDDLVRSVATELTGLLELQDCSFRAGAEELVAPLPRLQRSGVIDVARRHFVAHEFALPTEGVELPVVGNGRTLGRFVLTPDPDAGVSLEARIVAVALADQLGAALAGSAGVPNPHTTE